MWPQQVNSYYNGSYCAVQQTSVEMINCPFCLGTGSIHNLVWECFCPNCFGHGRRPTNQQWSVEMMFNLQLRKKNSTTNTTQIWSANPPLPEETPPKPPLPEVIPPKPQLPEVIPPKPPLPVVIPPKPPLLEVIPPKPPLLEVIPPKPPLPEGRPPTKIPKLTQQEEKVPTTPDSPENHNVSVQYSLSDGTEDSNSFKRNWVLLPVEKDSTASSPSANEEEKMTLKTEKKNEPVELTQWKLHPI